jgi:hypothetical protein
MCIANLLGYGRSLPEHRRLAKAKAKRAVQQWVANKNVVTRNTSSPLQQLINESDFVKTNEKQSNN